MEEATLTQLTERVLRLESRLARLEAQVPQAQPFRAQPPAPTGPSLPPPIAAAPSPVAAAPPVTGSAAAPAAPAAHAGLAVGSPTAAADTPSFEAVLKWVGIALLVLAAGFLVSTAVQRGWIGPELQWAGAVAGGVALVGVAERFRSTRASWSLAFALGGFCVLAVAALFGQIELDIYGVGVALGLVVAVVAAAGLVAWRHGRASIAGLGVGIATYVPLALEVPVHLGLGAEFVVLAMTIVGFSVVAVMRRWDSLHLTTVLLTAPAVLAGAAEAGDGSAGDRAVGGVLIALWLGAHLLPAVLAAGGRRKLHPMLSRSLLLWPLIGWLGSMLAASLELFDSDDRAFVAALVAGFAVAAAALGLHQLRRLDEEPALSLVLGAAALTAIGLTGLIDGPLLLVALTVLAVGLGGLAYRFEDGLVTAGTAVLASAVGLWTLARLGEAVDLDQPIGDDLANLFVLGCGGVLVALSRGRSWFGLGVVSMWVAAMLWVLGVFAHLPQGQMIVSMIWAAAGATVLLFGLNRPDHNAGRLGLATLGVTVLKLVTVDLDAVDSIWRAGLFFVVGLALVRLGMHMGRSDEDDGTLAEMASGPGAPAGAQQTAAAAGPVQAVTAVGFGEPAIPVAGSTPQAPNAQPRRF